MWTTTPAAASGSGPPPEDPPEGGSRRARTIQLLAVLGVVALVVTTTIVLSSRHDGEAERTAPTAGAGASTSSTAGGSTTASTAVTVPLEPDVQAVVDDLQAYVAAARGREFRHDVAIRLADDLEYEALVDQSLDIEAADVAATAALYEALGLIPPGSAETFAVELRERYHDTLGFYDFRTKLLVVRGVELDAATRRTLVHELVHALDDQWFDLGRDTSDPTAELADTYPMVIEGDATRIEQQWVADQPADVQRQAGGLAGAERSDRLSDFSAFIDFGFIGRYQEGRRFVTELARSGGEALVDAVFLDPPETTEQVLFPEVFERREGRIRVPPPPADGAVVDQRVIGALFWRALLAYEGSPVPDEQAAAATRGWGGDWQVTWVAGDLTCTRMDVVGDTALDTAELLHALTLWGSNRPQVTVSDAGGRARLEVCYRIPAVGDIAR